MEGRTNAKDSGHGDQDENLARQVGFMHDRFRGEFSIAWVDYHT